MLCHVVAMANVPCYLFEMVYKYQPWQVAFNFQSFSQCNTCGIHRFIWVSLYSIWLLNLAILRSLSHYVLAYQFHFYKLSMKSCIIDLGSLVLTFKKSMLPLQCMNYFAFFPLNKYMEEKVNVQFRNL